MAGKILLAIILAAMVNRVQVVRDDNEKVERFYPTIGTEESCTHEDLAKLHRLQATEKTIKAICY